MKKGLFRVAGLVMLWGWAQPGWAVTFGETGTGTAGSTGLHDVLRASRFTPPATGSVNRIVLYVNNASGQGRVALYDDNGSGGQPAGLLAQSDEQNLVAGWNWFTLPETAVDSSRPYWLSFQVNRNPTEIAYYADFGSYPTRGADFAYAAFPWSFPSPSFAYDEPRRYCIYATLVLPAPTVTSTLSPTHTRTVTMTGTPTPTQTPLASLTPTPTLTPTRTITSTSTASPTRTGTPTGTPTLTATQTASPTLTRTATLTATLTATQTATPTLTRTMTRTITATPSITHTVTATPPVTATPSVTATLVVTPTPRDVMRDLTQVRVFPNPWRQALARERRVVIDRVTDQATVRLYTLEGRLVRTIPPGLDADQGNTRHPGDTGRITWGLTTQDGLPVASGVYLYVIQDPQGHEARGKIAVLR